MMEFVSWDYDIPNWMDLNGKIKFMFQTTNQYIYIIICICMRFLNQQLIVGHEISGSLHRGLCPPILFNVLQQRTASWRGADGRPRPLKTSSNNIFEEKPTVSWEKKLSSGNLKHSNWKWFTLNETCWHLKIVMFRCQITREPSQWPEPNPIWTLASSKVSRSGRLSVFVIRLPRLSVSVTGSSGGVRSGGVRSGAASCDQTLNTSLEGTSDLDPSGIYNIIFTYTSRIDAYIRFFFGVSNNKHDTRYHDKSGW